MSFDYGKNGNVLMSEKSTMFPFFQVVGERNIAPGAARWSGCLLPNPFFMATNATTNRLSLTLGNEKRSKINDLLTQLNTELDFAIGLTSEERQTLPKMNDGNQPFVEDALNGAQQNLDIFPAYVKLGELQKDYDLFMELGPLVMRLLQLGEKLLDTQILAGSEAYVTALMIYRLADSAAKAGLPGADALYQQLRKRFAGQGTPAPETSGLPKG